MDTEEDIKLQKALKNGTPETDQGPYYHDSWWESYKGSVKGKFGGLVIGALVGAVVGAIAFMLLPAGILTTGAFAATVASFSAAGLLYGEHEFSEIGKVTGAVAAAHDKAEQRMKSFEAGKFAEIQKEIGDIKSLLTGQKPDEPLATSKAEADYRTTHCDEHCQPENRKLVYWKIAAIGAAVGIGAAAILSAGSMVASLPLAAVTLGLFGASFGINRDIFREVFDKTDLWFKGVLKGKGNAPVKSAEPAPVHQKTLEKASPIVTVVYENSVEEQQPATIHRDRVHASRIALLSMDHTKAIPH